MNAKILSIPALLVGGLLASAAQADLVNIQFSDLSNPGPPPSGDQPYWVTCGNPDDCDLTGIINDPGDPLSLSDTRAEPYIDVSPAQPAQGQFLASLLDVPVADVIAGTKIDDPGTTERLPAGFFAVKQGSPSTGFTAFFRLDQAADI